MGGCASDQSESSLTTLDITTFKQSEFDRYISYLKTKSSYCTKQGDICKVYTSIQSTEEEEYITKVFISNENIGSLYTVDITIRWNEDTPTDERISDIDKWIRYNVRAPEALKSL